ncbi:hypothetical protein [Flectobacillus sp. BAB-3569]|nr:hypothetical protein [Flectobacillus sp. BAB-3569]
MDYFVTPILLAHGHIMKIILQTEDFMEEVALLLYSMPMALSTMEAQALM